MLRAWWGYKKKTNPNWKKTNFFYDLKAFFSKRRTRLPKGTMGDPKKEMTHVPREDDQKWK
jgi:hypothetical protein